jgi:DNA-cytosine methyltransferase
MNVLSLFDGCSCGRAALERAGIPVTNYYAAEIDKHAMTVSKMRWPDIVQLGDVRNVRVCDLPFVPDLVIAGSPCQGFSFAGKRLNFDDPRSKLYWEFHRILQEAQAANPNVKFMLENVRMDARSEGVISESLNIQPVLINSALVSAQNRERLYWTDIWPWEYDLVGMRFSTLPPPEDRGLVLADIIESGEVDREKSLCIDANYYKGGSLKGKIEKESRQQSQSEQRLMVLDKPTGCIKVGQAPGKFESKNRIYSDEGKAPTLLAPTTGGAEPPKVVTGRHMEGIAITENGIRPYKNDGRKGSFSEIGTIGTPDTKSATCLSTNVPKYTDADFDVYNLTYRKLTVTECERLQTMDDNYTAGVSNTQRYRMIGNGWTIEVISWIFKGLLTS